MALINYYLYCTWCENVKSSVNIIQLRTYRRRYTSHIIISSSDLLVCFICVLFRYVKRKCQLDILYKILSMSKNNISFADASVYSVFTVGVNVKLITIQSSSDDSVDYGIILCFHLCIHRGSSYGCVHSSKYSN